jgi:cytochrome b561
MKRDAMPSDARYSTVAITLHWLIGFALLAQIALGLWMIEIPKEPVGVRAYWFNLHKSIGMTLAALIALRIGWRLAHRPPPLPASLARWQQQFAHVNHRLLYACMVVMPLSGFLGSTFSGFPIRFFGIVLAGWGWKQPALKDFFSLLHLCTAWLFIALIAVHVAAALKHLLIERDGVFSRMLPGRAQDAAAADRRITT